MLTYRLPQFTDYLALHYHALYKHYLGRLIETFPSFRSSDNNLVIAHNETDQPEEDELIIQLWNDFKESCNK